MKGLYLTVLLLIGAMPLFACNQCGCSTSNSAMGLMPISASNYVGSMMLFSHQSLYFEGGLISKASSFQANVFGGFMLNEKWSLQVMMPAAYNTIQTVAAETTLNTSGLFPGDMQLLGRYVKQFAMNDKKNTAQVVSFSFGVELPTGKFNPNYKQEDLPASFYPGSNSFDPVAGVQYQISKGSYSLAGNAQFRYSTFNSNHFKAGAQLSAAAFVLRRFGAWSPFCGLGMDVKESDRKYSVMQEGSDYELAYAMAGLEWSGKNIIIGTRNHLTLISKFGETDTKSPGLLSAYFSYFF